MKKIKLIISTLLLTAALPVKAVCPVCIVAVGAGLGLSQYLGIDDTIAGLWIGGLLAAISFWTTDWLSRKGWLNKQQSIRDLVVFALYYGLTIWPLWSNGLIGHPFNTLWSIDKILLGMAIGSLALAGSSWWYENMKKKNGRAHFPYEKVALPFSSLAILSLAFYILTK